MTVLYGTHPPVGVKVIVEPEAIHDPGMAGVMVGSVCHGPSGAEKWSEMGALGATLLAGAGEKEISRRGVRGKVVGDADALASSDALWLPRPDT